MSTIQATERLITRPWPQPMELPKPEQQVRSTHQATCPECSNEVRVKVSEIGADVFNTCKHFAGIEHIGDRIVVEFGE